ncbi:MAG TPA: hypothetical protein PKA76_01060 [Pirellulaceae bacterium]|nr:hypothetical protein [Pirellulaceae bacterium]
MIPPVVHQTESFEPERYIILLTMLCGPRHRVRLMKWVRFLVLSRRFAISHSRHHAARQNRKNRQSLPNLATDNTDTFFTPGKSYARTYCRERFMLSRADRLCICLLCAVSVAAASGCTVGPHLIRGSRTGYNSAVQTTTNEEMLLNLVRVRYGEPPEFLAVSGITTQFEASSAISAGGGEVRFGGGNNRFQSYLLPSAEFGAADRPTVTLLPLHDEEFTRRFLSPISLDTIYLFARNGRRVERVLRLTVDQINGVKNLPDGVGSEGAPGAFVWLAQTLGQLAKLQQVELAYRKISKPASPPLDISLIEGKDVVGALEKDHRFEAAGEDKWVLSKEGREPVLRIAGSAVGTPAVEGITELLQLKPGEAFYPLEPAIEGQLKPVTEFQEELHVSTRSVEEILHFLSFGVAVPPEHVERNLIGHLDELPVVCSAPSDNLLRIHWSKKRPHHAAVAIHHRGHWFYIDDADAASKETFELLLELYHLEIRGGGAADLPVLTLPIGR